MSHIHLHLLEPGTHHWEYFCGRSDIAGVSNLNPQCFSSLYNQDAPSSSWRKYQMSWHSPFFFAGYHFKEGPSVVRNYYQLNVLEACELLNSVWKILSLKDLSSMTQFGTFPNAQFPQNIFVFDILAFWHPSHPPIPACLAARLAKSPYIPWIPVLQYIQL